MHVAEFYLYNSYIPQQFRKMINEFYATKGNSRFQSYRTNSNGEKVSEYDVTQGTRYDLRFNYLVNDDVQLAIQNQFGKITNLVGMGGLGSIPSLLKYGPSLERTGKSKLSGGESFQNLNNLFNYSIWQKTEPLIVNVSIVLYAKTDPLIDVVIPAYTIMSHCIIDYVKENSKNPDATFTYSFPGLTAYEVTKINAVFDDAIQQSSGVSVEGDPFVIDPATNKKVLRKTYNSKLISLYIDGLVSMDLAMIKNITPVFSKHTAKSSYSSQTKYANASYDINNTFNGDYPIYAEINLQIESLVPADSNMLWAGVINNYTFNYSPDKSLSNLDTQPSRQVS